MNAFNHPEWTKDKNIYEVNVRQYTPEGTLQAFQQHLPRLKEMGVDIVWLMPIHPIGEKNRKGTLGSQYAAKDYTDIDPALGSKDDFSALVQMAHQLEMYVVLDWVANHTAWDHVWVKQHPDWYKKNEQGELYPYTYQDSTKIEYWTDVIGLDYDNKALWQGMTDAMAYWVKNFDVDGFRCDVAGLVPTPFWNFATAQLNQLKHLFFLAEWSSPDLHEQAFDMTYDWGLYKLMGEIAQGQKSADAIASYYHELFEHYPLDAYRMLFTSNHDKNTWEASDTEFFGESFKVFSVLAMTLYGMPLIYSGQEAILDKRLEFFEKDPIDWKDYPLHDFYRELLALKHNNDALWNGPYGAQPQFLDCENSHVIAYVRETPTNRVHITLNLSASSQNYKNTQTNETCTLAPYCYEINTL